MARLSLLRARTDDKQNGNIARPTLRLSSNNVTAHFIVIGVAGAGAGVVVSAKPHSVFCRFLCASRRNSEHESKRAA